MYRVLLVDDQPPFRQLARRLLEASGQFSVVGEAADGAEAIRLAEEMQPDLVVMDVQMKGLNGLEATRRITARQPSPLVLVVSLFHEQEYSRMATECGAVAFLPKREFSAASVLAAVNQHQRPA